MSDRLEEKGRFGLTFSLERVERGMFKGDSGMVAAPRVYSGKAPNVTCLLSEKGGLGLLK